MEEGAGAALLAHVGRSIVDMAWLRALCSEISSLNQCITAMLLQARYEAYRTWPCRAQGVRDVMWKGRSVCKNVGFDQIQGYHL
jgi:hypothetical protein